MIIDLILDRREGKEYRAKDFYTSVSNYGDTGVDIANALDSGDNEDIQRALCKYIIDNDYNRDICYYINNINWLIQ